MLDHVTFHVPPGTLARGNGRDITLFFELIGYQPTGVEESAEGLEIRWFRSQGLFRNNPFIHVVEGRAPHDFSKYGVYDQPVLGHICARVPDRKWLATAREAQRLGWLERHREGSHRFWIKFANIRVEVRSDASAATD